MAAKLGQLLITSHVITEEQLNEAVTLQRREGGRLGTNLVKLGYVTEEKLIAFLSRQWGVPAVTLSDYKIDPSVLKLIPIEIARKYLIIPVARVGATLTIAMADPSNVFVIDDVKFMTGFNVDVVVASESSILQSISTYYRSGGGALTAPKKEGPKEAAKLLQVKDYTFSEEDMREDELSPVDDGVTVDVDEFDKVVRGSANRVPA